MKNIVTTLTRKIRIFLIVPVIASSFDASGIFRSSYNAVASDCYQAGLMSDKEMKVFPEIETQGPVQANQDGNRMIRIYIDGVLSPETDLMKVREDLGYNWGILRNLRGKEAADKYGAGVTEVYEIITRKKAIEQGLNPPFPRLKPDDYPTFQGETYSSFNEWVAGRVNYPPQAKAENVQGWVSVRLTIGKDGAISGIEPASYPNRLLLDEVVRVINSAPEFDPPKNPAVNEPFTTEVTVRFKLPETVSGMDIPFVVVEQMPRYPGGDAEMLRFIADNVKYPEEAKKNGINGRVIVRFVVTTEGNAENVTVLRGVDPLLDAEAVRVVNMLEGFEPGMQSGKVVNVWYMVPITFALP